MMQKFYLEDDKQRLRVLKQLEDLVGFYDYLSYVCGYSVKSLYSNLLLLFSSEEYTVRPYFIISHLLRESLYLMINSSKAAVFVNSEYEATLLKKVPKEVIEKLESNEENAIKFKPDRKTFTIKLHSSKLDYIDRFCRSGDFNRSDWSGVLREIASKCERDKNIHTIKYFLKKNFEINESTLETVAEQLKTLHGYFNKHSHFSDTYKYFDEKEFYDRSISVLMIFQDLDKSDRSLVGFNKQLKFLVKEGNDE